MEPIVNRVAESDIIVFNLEEFWDGKPVVELDLEPFLFQGLVVREKDFREKVKEYNWEQYRDRHVAVYCSTDAIIATWAYMLVASRLDGIVASVAFGKREELVRDYFTRVLEEVDWSKYEDKPVVIKGCASKVVPPHAYLIATRKLQGVAKKLMYGEPCSSVPIWRQKTGQPSAGTATVKPVLPVRS